MNGKPILKEKDKPRKERSHPSSWWQKKADKAMQDKGRELRLRCEVCRGRNEVGHHYHTKSNSSYLRYSWDNFIPLCHSCHFKHHNRFDPTIHDTINRKRGLEWQEALERDRRKEVLTGVGYYKGILEMIENTTSLVEY